MTSLKKKIRFTKLSPMSEFNLIPWGLWAWTKPSINQRLFKVFKKLIQTTDYIPPLVDESLFEKPSSKNSPLLEKAEDLLKKGAVLEKKRWTYILRSRRADIIDLYLSYSPNPPVEIKNTVLQEMHNSFKNKGKDEIELGKELIQTWDCVIAAEIQLSTSSNEKRKEIYVKAIWYLVDTFKHQTRLEIPTFEERHELLQVKKTQKNLEKTCPKGSSNTRPSRL